MTKVLDRVKVIASVKANEVFPHQIGAIQQLKSTATAYLGIAYSSY